MYTVIEALTRDGRDLSLDYKISRPVRPARFAWDAKVLDAIAPAEDEIVLPKTSSSVFISTNIDYVLRNLGVRSLIIAGVLTDQCIDSAVRDACDLGYLVTVPTDACATLSAERHEWALRNNRGYCRQVTTDALLQEIVEVAKQSTVLCYTERLLRQFDQRTQIRLAILRRTIDPDPRAVIVRHVREIDDPVRTRRASCRSRHTRGTTANHAAAAHPPPASPTARPRHG